MDEGSDDNEAVAGTVWLDDEGTGGGAVVEAVVVELDESLAADELTNNGIYWA